MWESRPLPKIVRDPLAAHSARGSFFVPAPSGIFLFGDGRQTPGDVKTGKACGEENLLGKRFSSPHPPLPKTFAGESAFCQRLCMDENAVALAVQMLKSKML